MASTSPRSVFQAFVLDVFFGVYLAITLHRIIWHRVLLNSEPNELTMPLAIVYGSIGVVLAILLHAMKASPGRKIFGLTIPGWRDALAVHMLWIAGVATVVTSWVVTKVSLIDLFSGDRLQRAGQLFGSLFTPEFSIAGQAASAMVETIYLSLMATLLALPITFVLGFLSARNLMKQNNTTFVVYNLVRIATNFTRSIEPLIWAIIFSVWVGIGPFAGMLALMVHTIASLAKLYSEQIENIDPGPMEAIEATGASPLQVVWFAVVPQIVIPFLSFTIYRWDINVRMATIIGLVGGGGIGDLLMQYQGLGRWNEVGLIVLLIAAVVWLMDYISAKVREAIQ